MKILLFLLFLLTSWNTHGSERDKTCPATDLLIPGSKANPIVKISPKYPAHSKGILPACVIVSFVLAEKPGSDGQALIPEKIEIEVSSNDVWNRPAANAIRKWLYLADNVDYRGRQWIKLTFQMEDP